MKNGEPTLLQFYTPAMLEAHAPWKDTDLAKFLTTLKSLNLSFDGSNWSDYHFSLDCAE